MIMKIVAVFVSHRMIRQNPVQLEGLKLIFIFSLDINPTPKATQMLMYNGLGRKLTLTLGGV